MRTRPAFHLAADAATAACWLVWTCRPPCQLFLLDPCARRKRLTSAAPLWGFWACFLPKWRQRLIDRGYARGSYSHPDLCALAKVDRGSWVCSFLLHPMEKIDGEVGHRDQTSSSRANPSGRPLGPSQCGPEGRAAAAGTGRAMRGSQRAWRLRRNPLVGHDA